MKKEDYLQFTIALAKKAGKLIMANYGKNFSVEFKEKNSKNLVTAIDKASEKLIIKQILTAFPEHKILSEEGASGQNTATEGSDYLWVIDPIDGTTNFAHGYSFFAVSIALLYKGAPIVGVVYAPMLKELFYAAKGQGAFLNNKPIHVSKVATLASSLLATGFAYKNWEINFPHFKYFLKNTQAIRRAGSAALDLCHVAAGRVDGYWEYFIKPWDIAAGALIVTEAGGKVTSLNGQKLDLYAQNILSTNGKIHKKISDYFKTNASKK